MRLSFNVGVMQAFEHPQNTAFGKIISTNNDLRSLGQNRARSDGEQEVRP